MNYTPFSFVTKSHVKNEMDLYLGSESAEFFISCIFIWMSKERFVQQYKNYRLYHRQIKILISVILMVNWKPQKKLPNYHTPVPVVILSIKSPQYSWSTVLHFRKHWDSVSSWMLLVLINSWLYRLQVIKSLIVTYMWLNHPTAIAKISAGVSEAQNL